MFEGMNMSDLMQKAQEMQKNLKEKQDEAARQKFDVSVGGGMVQVTMNGKMEVISVKIDPEVMDPSDPEMLEDLIRSAFNEGVRQARKVMGDEMSKAMGGIKIPGFDMP